MRMKMCLPKYNRNGADRLVTKYCVDCEKEYIGHPISKFCPECNTMYAQNRRRREQRIVGPDLVNQPLSMRTPITGETIEIEYKCALEGCGNHFRVKQVRGIDRIPKFCEDHRNLYKREYFTRMLQRKAA